MSEIKEVYVIEWMGPYNSLDEMYEREGIDSCCIYLITGRLPYDRRHDIKYVGITKRPPSKRLKDKDHQEKQKDIKEKQFWAGRFSVSRYNNLDSPSGRCRAEAVETLLIRYLANMPGVRMINEKKRYQDPRRPIAIISRWKKKLTDDQRYNKPSILSSLSDTLMYVDGDFYLFMRQNEEYAMHELTKACLEGTYQKLIKKLGKKDLLILDDFGMHPLTPEARLALLKT